MPIASMPASQDFVAHMPLNEDISPAEIFRAASERFQSSLSDEQRSMFVAHPSSASMLQAMQDFAASRAGDRPLLERILVRIERVSTRLRPFFQVIEIFVSSRPEYAAIAWGSIRLIFMLASNHADFLQKVTQMLEQMGTRLPIYENYVQELTMTDEETVRLGVGTARRVGEGSCSRIRRALAYVYADLIQFCHDICAIFSKKRSRFFAKIPGSFMVGFWKPFDVRFDTLLKRWDEHKTIVELELSFAASISHFRMNTVVEEKLRGIEQGSIDEKEQRTQHEMKRELLDWIQSPQWTNVFETVQDYRSVNSTEWFVQHPVIREWSESAFRHYDSKYSVLHISGKPGYGKTTLCTSLIEHLNQVRNNNLSTGTQSRSFVGYFYFDSQQPEATESASSWRAILSQLLHAFPTDQHIIDASILLRKNNTSGQPSASRREIVSLLKLVLEPIDQLFLVFDAIDECRDQEVFLRDLLDLSRRGRAVKVALFSRPTVTLPLEMQGNKVMLSLGEDQNFDDIVNFLLPSINALDDSSGLPHDLSPLDTAILVAKRADGMFLWARMFLDYVTSTNLSLRQRQHAILNVNQFQGLEGLYEAIIKQLLSSNNFEARQNVLKALRLVAFARRALNVEELALAVVCPLDRAVEKDDSIPDFACNLGRFSGALLELDVSRNVRFVHSSAIVYFTRAYQSGPSSISPERSIHIDYNGSHRLLALISLSYLYFTVNHGPLSGSKRVVADVTQQSRMYPLLDYCSKYWSFHVLDYLDRVSNFPVDVEDLVLIGLASKFMSKPHAVMTWIEACWMFKRPPSIRYGREDPSLQNRGYDLRHDPAKGVSKELAIAMSSLSMLAKDLSELNKSWAHVLCEEACEIWEPSISAFTTSIFWQRVSGSTVTSFGANLDTHLVSVCVQVGLSSDSSNMAIVRICFNRRDRLNLSDGYVLFEQWKTSPQEKLFEFPVPIPKGCLLPFKATYQQVQSIESADNSFEFPVAINRNLTRVVMPGGALKLTKFQGAKTQLSAYNSRFQSIDFVAIAAMNAPLNLKGPEDLTTFDIQISESGKYLLVVHKSKDLVEITQKASCQIRLAVVYVDLHNDDERCESDYRFLKSLALKPGFSGENDQANSTMLLHPTLPVVVVKYADYVVTRSASEVVPKVRTSRRRRGNAGVWDISSGESTPLRHIAIPSHAPLCFEDDGKSFYGIDLISHAQWAKESHSNQPYTTPSNFKRPFEAGIVQRNASETAILSDTRPQIHQQGAAVTYCNRKKQRGTVIIDMNNNGDVVLGSCRGNGVAEAEFVTRLPWGRIRDREATLLMTEDEKQVKQRRVLIMPNNVPFKRHHASISEDGGDNDFSSPFLLTRERWSIPTARFPIRGRLLSGQDLAAEARKRICYPQEMYRSE